MKKLLYSVLLLEAFCLSASAQKNYLPATIITTGGDTLHGLVNYRNWEKNPLKIEFKKEDGAAVEAFDTDKAAWFSIEGIDIYKKAIVNKDMAPVALALLEQGGFENEVKDTVFLRQVVKGEKLALYMLEDAKVHFYLQESGGQPEELTYKVYLSNGNSSQVITFNGYRNQLKRFVGDNKDVLKIIDRARYNETDLKKVFIALDTTAMIKTAESSLIKPAVKTFRIIAGGGITINSLTFTGENYRNLQNNKVPPTFGYSIRAGIDAIEKRHMQRMFLRSEVALGNFNYKNTTEGQNWLGQDEIRTYAIKMNLYTLALSGNYNFINNNNIKVYAGVGASFNYSVYSKNNYTVFNKGTGQTKTEGGLAFERKWFNFPAKIGLSNKKVDIAFATSLAGTFSNFIFIGTKYKTSGLYIMYHF